MMGANISATSSRSTTAQARLLLFKLQASLPSRLDDAVAALHNTTRILWNIPLITPSAMYRNARDTYGEEPLLMDVTTLRRVFPINI